MVKNLSLFWVISCLSIPVLSQLDEFFFDKFSSLENNISLNGAAVKIEKNGMIQLTNNETLVLGHAFYSLPIRFKNSTDGKAFSFSTAFTFAIVTNNPNQGGHGLAFVISPDKELKGALPSQYLGLLNPNDNNGKFSNKHVFAVEFDTVQNIEFGDINKNHVGVDINSLTSKASVPAAYFTDNSTKKELNLQSGNTIQAWIDYDSVRNELNVSLSPFSVKPKLPILSHHVDLSQVFKESMFVGLSASTSQLASSHFIFGWSFKMNGEAKSLSISSPISLPSKFPISKKDHLLSIIGASVSATFLIIFAIVVGLYQIRRNKSTDVKELRELDISPHPFSYKELKQATRGFKDKGLLGFGGFGRVYKGILPNSNTQVAVKRISHESKQGLAQFVSEIKSIGRLRHRNLVQLLGWCHRGRDLLLVYDFMPNGSLDKYLFDEPETILSWEQRFKVIKGVASGLLYLHEEWEQTVIHRDIKAGNVLLDSELNGRLGDFGLAKLYKHGSNPSTTRVVGTLGYLAPELTKTGKPTTSSDVFAFGALLLEVVCGRRPVEFKALPEELVLVDWVWERWREGVILNVVDKRLKGEYDEMEAVIVLKLGLMCSNNAPVARPTMKQVMRYLEGELMLPQVLPPPGGYDGNGGSSGSGEFVNYVQSNQTSLSFEKASPWLSDGDADMEN